MSNSEPPAPVPEAPPPEIQVPELGRAEAAWRPAAKKKGAILFSVASDDRKGLTEYPSACGTLDGAFMTMIRAQAKDRLSGELTLYLDGSEHIAELDSAEICIRLKPRTTARGRAAKHIVLNVRDPGLLQQILDIVNDDEDSQP